MYAVVLLGVERKSSHKKHTRGHVFALSLHLFLDHACARTINKPHCALNQKHQQETHPHICRWKPGSSPKRTPNYRQSCFNTFLDTNQLDRKYDLIPHKPSPAAYLMSPHLVCSPNVRSLYTWVDSHTTLSVLKTITLVPTSSEQAPLLTVMTFTACFQTGSSFLKRTSRSPPRSVPSRSTPSFASSRDASRSVSSSR